jgi:hypothetical protein
MIRGLISGSRFSPVVYQKPARRLVGQKIIVSRARHLFMQCSLHQGLPLLANRSNVRCNWKGWIMVKLAEPYTGRESRILLSFAMAHHGFMFVNELRDRLMKHFGYYSPTAVYMDNIAMRHVAAVKKHNYLSIDDLDADLKEKGAKKQDDHTYSTPDWRFNANLKVFDPATGTGTLPLGAQKAIKSTAEYLKKQGKQPFDEGYLPIGAANGQWNKWYEEAMSQAPVMIMVVTPDYLRSEYCMLEWCQFEKERRKRGGKMFGLVLTFVGDDQVPDQEYEATLGKDSLTKNNLRPSAKPINASFVEHLEFAKTKATTGLAQYGGPNAWTVSDTDFTRIMDTLEPHL